MTDTISRQAAIEHLKKRLYETALNNDTEHPYYEEMADNRVSVWLGEVPTIEPKRGRWEDVEEVLDEGITDGTHYTVTAVGYKCSECGTEMGYLWNFCPNCGAKMDEVEE